MKKVIIAVLIIAFLAGAGLIGWNVYDKEVASNPENLIVGEWKSENGLLSFVFKEDGTMSGNIDAILGVVSVNGSYTVDRENSQISIVYSLYSISYTDVKKFVIEGDVLTLTDVKTDITTVYTRAGAQAQQTAAA